MEGRILEAEKRLAAAQAAVEDPAVATDPKALQERCEEMETARQGGGAAVCAVGGAGGEAGRP